MSKAPFDGGMQRKSSIKRQKVHHSTTHSELFVGLITIPATLFFGGIAALWMQISGQSCGTKSLLGMPCPTCGSTRALIALLQGDVTRAFTLQPFVVTACTLALLYSAYSVAVLFGGMRPWLKWPRSKQARVLMLSLATTLFVSNWVFIVLSGR